MSTENAAPLALPAGRSLLPPSPLNEATAALYGPLYRSASAYAATEGLPPSWLAGYAEGAEHALETLRLNSPHVQAFLAALTKGGTR